MSELIDIRTTRWDFRRQLLASASCLALLASVCGIGDANADDTDRPTVWIELGGQLQQMSNRQEPYAPPFASNVPRAFYSLTGAQDPPHYAFGGEGAVSFEPNGNDWVFSAAVRFGRSNGMRAKHQQTPNAHVPVHFSISGRYFKSSKYPASHVKFEDFKGRQSESHVVLDFQAGKDVGLGIFGTGGSSVLNAGIRFAQFSSKTNVSMRAEPDLHYPSQPLTSIPAVFAFHSSAAVHFHDYAVIESNQRSFRGIGPSLAWNASAQFAGNQNAGGLTIDWGANAAILFGRQKVSGHHQTTAQSFYKKGFGLQRVGYAFATVSTSVQRNGSPFDRSRMVTVPNLGGFAGVSWRYPGGNVSLGYRADFFFGAMDGGIDTAKKETRGFYGPFATISVGLGG